MKYYTIEAGVVAQFITVDVATGERSITCCELKKPKSFNDDCFVSLKKCECCDDLISTFFLGEDIISGRLNKIYFVFDASDVSVSQTTRDAVNLRLQDGDEHQQEKIMPKNLFSLANAISSEKKSAALTIYKRAAELIASRHYVKPSDCDFTNLSAEFGQIWVSSFANEEYELLADLYAESNNAFNYANLSYGGGREFTEIAIEVLPKNERCDDKRIRQIAKQLSYYVTAVTREEVIERGHRIGRNLNVGCQAIYH